MTFQRWLPRFTIPWPAAIAWLLCVAAHSALTPARAHAAADARNATGPATSAEQQQTWLAKSRSEDPANLKHERVAAQNCDERLPEDGGRAGLEQAIRRLRTRASLLMIVAHPDDEDGGMLTYESRGQGARVGMLTLTRGEGGQNVMSGDFDDALGLVRTRELLAADRYFGVDQMFGTEADFGFSKTIEEAFSKWTHQRVLYDAVRAVRLYRPLVVTSVFIGGVTDGHGQHQVSGEIAQEVFRAAADPKLFPEMNLPPWQVLKVYARVPFATIDQRGMYDYATGKYAPARFHNYIADTWSATPPHADVTIPEGDVDPLLGGKSYVQFARQGLALQRTQIGSGMRIPSAGRFDIGYTRYGAAHTVHIQPKESSFFDGVDISLEGIAGLAPSLGSPEQTSLREQLRQVDADVTRAEHELASSGESRGAAPALADATRMIDAAVAHLEAQRGLPQTERYDLLHELRIKRVQFNDALLLSLGVSVRAEVVQDGAMGSVPVPLTRRHDANSPRAAVREQRLSVQVDTTGSPDQDLRFRDDTAQSATGVRILYGDTSYPGIDKIAAGSVHSLLFEAEIAADAPYSRPYFTRADSEQPIYDLHDPRLQSAPVTPPALTVWQTVWYGDLPLTLGADVKVATRQDGVPQLLRIVPAVSVAIDPKAGVIPEQQQSFELKISVAAQSRQAAGGSVHLKIPAGWTATPERAPFLTQADGKPQQILFTVTPAHLGQEPYRMEAIADFAGKQYRDGVTTVGYPGLERDDLYAPASYRTRGVDVHVPSALRVAYLPGTGDAVAASLADIGIHPATISVADIAAGRLGQYDALLLGVRAYAAQKELPTVTSELLSFAAAGGVVVVQYNSAEYNHNYGPFPYSLTGAAEKVIEERAPVRLLIPEVQALRWPNLITPHDFDSWVEERGHGFMTDWDPHFAALTEVHDAGQDPQRGGLLIAPVGKGAYVYCAFALYRQLPEGVPGAFRLIANLLSLGRHPS